MEDSNLLFLIKSFSKTEKKEASRFLESPFFNQRDDLRQLFLLLSETENPQKEAAWLSLFPEKKYDDTAMRLLMSYLNRLLERYLIIKEGERDAAREKLQLAIAYRRRGLSGQYRRTINALERQLDGQPLRNAQHLLTLRDLAFEKQATQTTADPTDSAAHRAAIEAADAHHLAERLRLLCLEAAQKGVYRTENAAPTDLALLEEARQKRWADRPAILFYRAAFEMLARPEDDAPFFEFKKLIADGAHFFPPEEVRELYFFAINHCVRRLNEGAAAFGAEVLQLYRRALEGGFLFENGHLSRFAYHNITAAALREGELEWAEKFMRSYRDRLEKTYRDGSFSFNLARLEQAHGRHERVLELLQNANYRDPLLHLPAKVLLLKTCWQIGAFDLLQSNIDALKNYVRRSEAIGYHRQNFLNIARFLEKIMSLGPSDKRAAERLGQQIMSEKVLSERAWLLSLLSQK